MSNQTPSSEIEYLFVYGTLRRSIAPSKDIRHLLHNESEYLGRATINGKLYNIGSYPGLILSEDPEEIVTGELYQIKNRRMILSTFDRYEGCVDPYPKPWEYLRLAAEVTTEEGTGLLSWLYTYQWDVRESMRIQSGDYLEFLSKQ